MGTFNFSGVEAAKAGNYLKPGYYRVRITDVKEGSFEKSGIPYTEITFQTKEGLAISEKFVLKSKEPNAKFNPLSRLVYLHETWLGEKVDADFKTPGDVAKYFKKVMVGKEAGVKTIVVGGEQSGKIVYGRIPLTEFVIIKTDDIILGAFEEGSEEWKQYVKKSTRTTEATGKKGGLLNADDDDKDEVDPDEDDVTDDTDAEEDPFEEEEKPKEKSKTKPVTEEKKKTVAKTEEKKPVEKTIAKKEDKEFDW
jgi:hypothetical protein